MFLERSLALASAAIPVPWLIPGSALGAAAKAPANSRINIGMIGTGRQVFHANLPAFLSSPDTQVVALCDADAWRLEKALAKVNDHYSVQHPGGTYKGCRTYSDFRELLARPDVDAVMISTPDHWHVYMGIAAAQAGKDVALEKPISLTIHQGRALCRAMEKHQRIFRTDTEVRTEGAFRRLCEIVRNGLIGKIKTIDAGVPAENEPLRARPAPMPVPPELDYAMWLGPAPAKPYTEQRVHPQKAGLSYERKIPGWMQIQDYTDGMILNWGTHLLDIAQWAHNTERTGPVEVEGTGSWPDNFWDVLQEFKVRYQFGDGVELRYTMAGRPYVRVEGTDGWVEAEWWKGLQTHPKTLAQWKPGPNDLQFPLLSEKIDFINSIKSRQPTQIPAEIGHRTASLCQLGVIAIKLGRKLQWDPVKETFPNDREANTLLSRPMRAPWTLPTLS